MNKVVDAIHGEWQAQINMWLIQRESLNSGEEDGQIERGPIERQEQVILCEFITEAGTFVGLTRFSWDGALEVGVASRRTATSNMASRLGYLTTWPRKRPESLQTSLPLKESTC